MRYRALLLPASLLLTSLCTLEAGADQSPTSELMRRAAARVEATVIAPSADRRTPLFAFTRTRILRPNPAARFTRHLEEDAAGRSYMAFTLHHQDRQEAGGEGEEASQILGWGCYYPATDDVFVGHPRIGFVAASPDSSSPDLAAADRSRCINGD